MDNHGEIELTTAQPEDVVLLGELTAEGQLNGKTGPDGAKHCEVTKDTLTLNNERKMLPLCILSETKQHAAERGRSRPGGSRTPTKGL